MACLNSAQRPTRASVKTMAKTAAPEPAISAADPTRNATANAARSTSTAVTMESAEALRVALAINTAIASSGATAAPKCQYAATSGTINKEEDAPLARQGTAMRAPTRIATPNAKYAGFQVRPTWASTIKIPLAQNGLSYDC